MLKDKKKILLLILSFIIYVGTIYPIEAKVQKDSHSMKKHTVVDSDSPTKKNAIKSPNYPTDWILDTKSDIGILLAGWGDALGHIMGKYNEPVTPVKPDLTILNEPERSIFDVKVLLIGSVSLKMLNDYPLGEELSKEHTVKKGETLWYLSQLYLDNPSLWTSIWQVNKRKIKDPDKIYPGQKIYIPRFWFSMRKENVRLREFVKQGGNIICLTQAYGNEFNVLPVSFGEELSGYGWDEDISSCKNSVYIDNWHSILVGQERRVFDANVDGFFDRWPSNAEVLLRKNNELKSPVLLIYCYGEGKILVTSLYSDWCYGQGKYTNNEITLLRDAVSWALDPKTPILEYKEGEEISSEFIIHNSERNRKPARKVQLKVYNPDRKLLSTISNKLSTPLQPGDSTIVNFTFTSSHYLGIYWVNYILLDSLEGTIQTEKRGARFAVSNPPEGIIQQ